MASSSLRLAVLIEFFHFPCVNEVVTEFFLSFVKWCAKVQVVGGFRSEEGSDRGSRWAKEKKKLTEVNMLENRGGEAHLELCEGYIQSENVYYCVEAQSSVISFASQSIENLFCRLWIRSVLFAAVSSRRFGSRNGNSVLREGKKRRNTCSEPAFVPQRVVQGVNWWSNWLSADPYSCCSFHAFALFSTFNEYYWFSEYFRSFFLFLSTTLLFLSSIMFLFSLSWTVRLWSRHSFRIFWIIAQIVHLNQSRRQIVDEVQSVPPRKIRACVLKQDKAEESNIFVDRQFSIALNF